MDGSRFDRLTQVLVTGRTRRQALLGVAGSALAGVLGLTRVEAAAAACVKPGKKGCKGPKNGKCCRGSVCRGGNKRQKGRCRCKGGTKQCGAKCVNTKQDNKHCGDCNQKCIAGNTCQSGVCTGSLGCKAGQNICDSNSVDDLCPGNGSCGCLTSVEGTAHCTDYSEGFCSECTTSAECPPGLICAAASHCCSDPTDPFKNICIIAICGGVNGSTSRANSAGSGGFRPPLGR